MSDLKKVFSDNKQLIGLMAGVSLVIGAAAGLVVGTIAPIYVTPWWNTVSHRPTEASASTNQTQTTQTVEEESQTIDVVNKVSPSVVSIIISKDLNKIQSDNGGSQSPLGNDFFGFPGFDFGSQQQPQQQPDTTPKTPNKQQVGGGTGFFISDDGLILTNKHVVADTEADYSVLTSDGKTYDAKVLARDPSNDIAMVKIDVPNIKFTPVVLGDSDAIKIGQTVVAIGNSLGEYSNTVTKGVISGIGRRVTAGDNQGQSEVLEEAIQTDAAINPGNSGGPLIDLAGEVIAVNSAVNEQGQLIGFSIPINQAKQVIESVKQFGRIIRPFLGVRYTVINDDLVKKNNLPVDHGALILRGDQGELAVTPGSPADKAGIVENDIILEVNGKAVDADHSLSSLISVYKPGDTIDVTIYHKGKEETLKVILEEFKDNTTPTTTN